MKHRLAIFVSGNGSNAEEIMKYFTDHPAIEVALMLTNNSKAYAIERAKKFAVPCKIFSKQDIAGEEVLHWLSDFRISHVCLAGYLWLIPESLINAYPNKIINIHPALLPKYGGKGMYGMKVHEAIRANNEVRTGITIHLVNTKYDEGKIIAQEYCDVAATDTPEDIAKKVHELEHKYYPAVIERWINEQ